MELEADKIEVVCFLEGTIRGRKANGLEAICFFGMKSGGRVIVYGV